MVLTTFIKYLLHTVDLQSENPWDNKAVYMLYTELFTGTQPAQLWSVLLSTVCVNQDQGGDSHTDITVDDLYSRFHQSAAVHRLHDHHDQGPHLPSVCHPAHVSGYEVSRVTPH